MSKQVDVLKVIDDEIESLPKVVSLAMGGATISNIEEPVARLQAARAAIAELIEAVKLADEAATTAYYDGDMEVREIPMPHWKAAMAALAAVQGPQA